MPINSKVISDKETIFTLQKNILSNSKINIEIPFGKYEDFKIFSGNNKAYVNIFDSQNNKIYLFDKELDLIKGFSISSKDNAHFLIDKKELNFQQKQKIRISIPVC